MQRKDTALGKTLGKTTGWTHRLALKRRGVRFLPGVQYKKIDDDGLHLVAAGEYSVLPVDTVIVCAGQEPLRDLYQALCDQGLSATLVGGAHEAAELDAKAAIDQATRLAAVI